MKKIILIILIFFLCHNIFCQEQEYILKSAFIEKFCRFTEWPSESIDSSEYFHIALVGDNNFEKIFENIFNNITLKNKPVKIHRVKNIDRLKILPHLMFISEDQKSDLDRINQFASQNNILTVGDSKDFGVKGIHINFYLTDQETLHFTINLKSVEDAKLRINLMLIEIAKVI